MESLKYIGIGLSALSMIGAAVGICGIFSSLLDAIARNPSAEDKLTKNALVGAGLVEVLGLFGFVIAILLLFG